MQTDSLSIMTQIGVLAYFISNEPKHMDFQKEMQPYNDFLSQIITFPLQ